ncbi:hypothetical protein PBY51_015470 [Eleginops maclovinus]|uniref:Uncharacterized protein n=1 Tax=Eleginops maclovinus TaxID=56733 RepID=A0AAN8ABZ5_ELEMC|nr:hypothetical protein PBY51_015470 [Eleginops maclovinus]
MLIRLKEDTGRVGRQQKALSWRSEELSLGATSDLRLLRQRANRKWAVSSVVVVVMKLMISCLGRGQIVLLTTVPVEKEMGLKKDQD